MECNLRETNNINACFVPSIDARCTVGDVCTVTESLYNSGCFFTGVSDQFLSKLVGSAFDCFSLTKKCISDEIPPMDNKCDFLMGVSYNKGNLSDKWLPAGIYNTETISALYASDIKYGPWDFLAPFSVNLWVTILCIMFILTPLVMSFVEYDEDETIWENFWKFLPDSIHAHMGVDLVNNDLPTKNTSHVLSVFVSIFSFTILTLYASNLITYVLYKSSGSLQVSDGIIEGSAVFVENSLTHLVNIPNSTSVYYYNIPALHASGKFDVIIAEDFFLRDIKTCEENIIPFHALGSYKYLMVASKLGEDKIKTIQRTMRHMEYITRVYRDTCQTTPVMPIKLSGIYGVYIIFFAPTILITIAVIFRHYMFKKPKNQYVTPSL